MFELITFEEEVRVPPEFLGKDRNKAIQEALSKKYENRIINNESIVLRVNEVVDSEGGLIKEDDPGVYYTTKAKMLVYTPKLHEVVQGEVVDITDFGVFVRFGPLDGLCHISQVIDDYLTFDKKSLTLRTKETNKTLKIGDVVRARITGISLEKRDVNKIILTMRQPGLGALEWIYEDNKDNKSNDN